MDATASTRSAIGFTLTVRENLLAALSPKRICIYALSVIMPQIFTATEFLYAGADPNEMRFKRAGCFDVGVACGGWGASSSN